MNKIKAREKLKAILAKKVTEEEKNVFIDKFLESFYCDAHDEGFNSLEDYEKKNGGKK